MPLRCCVTLSPGAGGLKRYFRPSLLRLVLQVLRARLASSRAELYDPSRRGFELATAIPTLSVSTALTIVAAIAALTTGSPGIPAIATAIPILSAIVVAAGALAAVTPSSLPLLRSTNRDRR